MKNTVKTTLCYIEKDDCYLMLLRNRKKDDENKGKWIGVGGHFEDNESPEQCLLREVKEETGLRLSSYSFRGIITFVSDKYGTEYMYLYTADGFDGEIGDCDEGELKWIRKSEIMSLELWEGDKEFLPLLIAGEKEIYMKLTYVGDKLIEVLPQDGKEVGYGK